MKKIMKHIYSRFSSGQAGQALIIVLVLLVLGSLTIIPVLDHIGTALKTGEVYESKSSKLYAADAGIEDAIWQIKYDRLPILFDNEDYAYDFDTVCAYELDEPINGMTVNVTIQNVWTPSNTTLGDLGLSPAEAREIIERDVTDNTTNRLIVTGTAIDDVNYRIKIDYYPAIGENGTLEISSIGVWLPHGFTYDGNCNLEDAPYDLDPPSTSPQPGGQGVLWDFSADPILFDDLPPYGDYSVQIVFDYDADEANTRPIAIGWVVTTGDLSDDIPISWDIDTKIYKVVATAGDTTVEAYPSRCDLRQVGAAFLGDYLAIGNTLMRDIYGDNRRDILDSESTSDTQNDDESYRIPMDATVVDAYLYWSGWFKCDAYHPNATIFWDSCSNLDDWTRTGSDWYDGGSDIEGYYDGGSENDRYLELEDAVDLSGRIEGAVVVGWEQSESGSLEPLSDPTNGDALKFQLYNATTGWSDLITAFEDDIGSGGDAYYYVIPAAYLTADFKIRFYLHGFGGSNEYCQIDDFHIGDVADTDIAFKIGDPLDPDYSDTLGPLEFEILGNASVGEYSFSCMQNVKDLVKTYSIMGDDENPTGNGEYTVGGVLSDTGEHWSYAAWSLIIIYSSPETAGHQLYKFDRFAFCNTNINLDFDFDGEPGGTIDGFIVPEPIEGETNAAKLTCFVGEGDRDWYSDFIALNAPEEYWSNPASMPNQYKLWDGINTTANSEASPNNVWNSRFRSVEAGTSTIDGVDIDTFYITWASDKIRADDTEAHIDIYTNYENFNLIYLILSVRSKTRIGGTTHYVISGT